MNPDLGMKIRTLFKDGVSRKDIAEMLGIPYSQVANHLRSIGLADSTCTWSGDERRVLRDVRLQYEKNGSLHGYCVEVAKMTGRSVASVRRQAVELRKKGLM